MRAYGEDLAHIHDVGFTGFARRIAPELLQIIGQRIEGGLVVDLGCGSGVWAAELVSAGHEVLGIDISAAMIRIARGRVPQGRFRVGSYHAEELPRCACVTSLGECFNYLFDPGNGRKKLGVLFRRVHEALEPGGLFVFDFAEPGRGGGVVTRAWEERDWAMFAEYEEDTRRRRLRRRIVTYRRRGKSYRRDEELHELQLYRAADLAHDLRKAGFRARVVRGYGAFRFPACYAGIIARKA